ncbi:hypothetical protein ACHQM5_010915 [Ranunculus cassubicifolius]
MKSSLQSLLGKNRKPLLRVFGTRTFAASPEDYAKRNYASNVSEYNTVLSSLTAQRRQWLLRDVYDDMLLDGIQPTRDTFHSLIVGTMKGTRLQDAFFFKDEMKAMGLNPDVVFYNFLISACGKSKNSDSAVRILEEMKNYGVKPNLQTYICLLHACAASGRLDRVYKLVSDMAGSGLGLNKFCYAGLIAAHVNKTPLTEGTPAKIVEYVEQSKGWSAAEPSSNSAENSMVGVTEEELYNLPTAEYINRRGFIAKPLTVFHVALKACADIPSIKAMEAILDILSKQGNEPDAYLVMQMIRCYLHGGDLDNGIKVFDDFVSKRPPYTEHYVALIEGAMHGYTDRGMKVAQEALEKMTSNGLFLNSKYGSELLLVAAGEKTGGYTMANYIWDLMETRRLTPDLPSVQAYYDGLKEREIAKDDPRFLFVVRVYDNLMRGGPRNAIVRD